MNWDKDKSVMLSRFCVVFFAVCLIALDIFAYRIADWYVINRLGHFKSGALFMVSVYCGSIFAWVCLYQLWKLLDNIKTGAVFVLDNVRRLRRVSRCCICVAVICLLSAAYYLPFIFLAAAFGFIALIVCIVKNAFRQGSSMKDELDLTV